MTLHIARAPIVAKNPEFHADQPFNGFVFMIEDGITLIEARTLRVAQKSVTIDLNAVNFKPSETYKFLGMVKGADGKPQIVFKQIGVLSELGPKRIRK